MLNKQIGWAAGGWLHTWGRFSISSDPMIEVILVIHFNFNPTLTPLQRRQFQLAKMPKIRDFNFGFRNIFWGIAPRPILGSRTHRRGGIDCQVLSAPQYLNPAVVKWVTHSRSKCLRVTMFGSHQLRKRVMGVDEIFVGMLIFAEAVNTDPLPHSFSSSPAH